MIGPITIGSDPEFVFNNAKHELLESYSILRPRRLVVCGKPEGKTDCNRCHTNTLFCGRNGGSAQIGTDGSLGELRPDPGKTPLEHVENIQKLINNLDFLPIGTILKGGTYENNLSVGGHIHIGVPIMDQENYVRTHIPIKDTAHFASFLSHYCGIPLRKIEKPGDLKHRGLNTYGFGRFGSYDTKSYGLEWRMPASWLVTKEIATAALSLAYVVAQNYDENYHPMKPAQYRGILKTQIKSTLNTIFEMEGYETYEKEIEPLIQMIINKEVWDTSRNILDTWK